MTTNTALRPAPHANCSHAKTKTDRARCRRSKVATAHSIARTVIAVGAAMIEPCSCNGPAVDNVCTLCDRPQG